MTLKDEIKELTTHNEGAKKRKFFAVKAVDSVPKLAYLREEMKWVELSKMVGLSLESSAIYRDESGVDLNHVDSSYGKGVFIELNFSNGLTIEDTGSTVSFWAKEDKSKVDISSSEKIVRCVANHLYRRGFGMEKVGSTLTAPISDTREGSSPLVHAFEKSYKETHKMLCAEKLRQLKSAKTH